MKRLVIVVIVGAALFAAVPGLRERAAPAVEVAKDGIASAYEILVNRIFTWSVSRELRSIAAALKRQANSGAGLPDPALFAEYLRRNRLAGGVDPWGHEYFLQTTRHSIIVGSRGPDGEIGTSDDIREIARIGE